MIKYILGDKQYNTEIASRIDQIKVFMIKNGRCPTETRKRKREREKERKIKHII